MVRRMDQRAATVFDPERRNEQMKMRMVVDAAGPGMEHCDKARFSTEVTWIRAELL
jgi:hypothetical protein